MERRTETQDYQAPVQTPSPDAVGRGVLGDSDTEPLTLFVLSGSSLGATPVEGGGEPQWFDLLAVENLDALGDPMDERQRIELIFEGGNRVKALLPLSFLDKLVERLQELLASGSMAGAPPAQPQPQPPLTSAPPPPPPPAPPIAEVPGSIMSHHTVEHAPLPGDGAAIAPSVGESGHHQLVMENVIYHGGFTGEEKRRKGCSLRLDHSGADVAGSSGPNFHLDWNQVASVEVQNPDEAKFRLNIKAKRNSTSFVISCLDGSSVLLEARDVPTVPMRHAVADLLTPHGVSVA
jgi:hypothetical protein